MVEWLAGIKLKALLGEGVSSLASTTAKGVGAKVGNVILEKFQPRQTGDPFAEHGPIADAIRPLRLSSEERERLVGYFNSELFASVVRASPSFTVGGKADGQRDLVLLYLKELLPDKPFELVTHLADEIVRRLQDASTEALEEAQAQGMVFPSTAAAGSARSIVAAEIASAAAQILESSPYSLEQLKSFELFEVSYRRQINRQYAKIRPEALGDATPVPIDELYVASDLRAISSLPSDPGIPRADLLKASFRTVILGNPGGGKSTFVKKLCHEMTMRYEEALYGRRKLTPVVIILKEYAQYRKLNPCSIVEFATLRAKADYQIDSVPDGAVRYLFISGRALIIFDGLDELIETADRLDITRAVERFVDQYHATPVLVTSREVGYEQAPLDHDKFETFKLQPFTPDQVAMYAQKWFRVTHEGTMNSAEDLAQSFIRDSQVVPDLRENPLMLSLLCNLYKKDKHLPANRPEVYKRCADLLFENWDKSRGILVSLPIEKKLRPAMDYLAHWIYADKTLQSGVTESAIVAETARYLVKWCSDSDEAFSIAEKFVQFFRGRAWVFSDVGSDRDKPLYGFTHTTFLEFFTAEYLVKNYGSSEEIADYLLPRLLNREWDVVCQLCFQMYAELRNASDELTNYLVDQIDRRPLLERVKLSSFLARSLDLIFPTRFARAAAVVAAIRTFIRYIETSALDKDASVPEASGIAMEIWQGLTSCDRDLRDVNVTKVSDEIRAYLSGGASAPARAALLTTLDVVRSDYEEAIFLDRDRAEIWNQMHIKIKESSREIRRSLLPVSVSLAMSSWWEGEIGIEELLNLHGRMALVNNLAMPFGMWVRPSVHAVLVNVVLDPESASTRSYFEDAKYLRLVMLRDKWPAVPSVPLWVLRGQEHDWPEDQNLRDFVVLSLRGARHHGGGRKLSADIGLFNDAKKDKAKLENAKARLAALKLSPEAEQTFIEWLQSPADDSVNIGGGMIST